LSHPILRRGSPDSAAVRQLQELLNQQGNTLVVDGDFGDRTHAAVLRFQTARGVPADGVVTAAVWAALEGPPQGRPAVVTANKLNLRNEPGGPLVLRVLTRGEKVMVLAQVNAWYSVQAGALKGYVHGDFLTFAVPEVQPRLFHEDHRFRALPLPPAPELPIPDEKPLRGVAATWNRFGGLLRALADELAIDVSAAVAVLQVESAGRGFLDDGRMVIRFEPHVFLRHVDDDRETLVRKRFRFDAQEPWKRHAYRTGNSWVPMHVTKLSLAANQDREWEALDIARDIDPLAALKAISMGAPQIMGFNHARIGYDGVEDMFRTFQADERFHVLGLFDFVRGPGAVSEGLVALQRRRWEDFASVYNGPGQASVYGARIATHVELANALPLV
jgi:hypothetical protein